MLRPTEIGSRATSVPAPPALGSAVPCIYPVGRLWISHSVEPFWVVQEGPAFGMAVSFE